MSTKKILVFTIPASGHINPLLPILKELNKCKSYELICYVNNEFKEKFESIGLTTKHINFNLKEKIDSIKLLENKREFLFFKIASSLLDEACNCVEYIAQEINTEKPNLIIYDSLAMHFKLAKVYYEKWFNLAKNLSRTEKLKLRFSPEWPIPPTVGFCSSFMINDEIYPNKVEASFMVSWSTDLVWDLMKLMYKCYQIGRRFEIGFINPIELGKMRPDNYTKLFITAVSPDLHPRSHLYDKKLYKFVGTTLNENCRDLKYDESIKEILDGFLDNQSLFLTEKSVSGNSVLIYASLGTVFNNNFAIYKKILDAFEIFDEEPEETKNKFINRSQIKVIVSTGEKVFDDFKDLIDKNEYKMPENVKLVKSAPQLEVLKRASLFFTHCGMNSTSESVHFGVPMVCIPLSEDQPLVAYRIADELGLGVRLDFTNMGAEKIRKAMHEILGDRSYYERSKRYSELSRKHNGYLNGSKLINELINQY